MPVGIPFGHTCKIISSYYIHKLSCGLHVVDYFIKNIKIRYTPKSTLRKG